jgi:hypothetical protein
MTYLLMRCEEVIREYTHSWKRIDDAFALSHTFCHSFIDGFSFEVGGAKPRRSIFMFPLESIGVGCCDVEGGTGMVFGSCDVKELVSIQRSYENSEYLPKPWFCRDATYRAISSPLTLVSHHPLVFIWLSNITRKSNLPSCVKSPGTTL